MENVGKVTGILPRNSEIVNGQQNVIHYFVRLKKKH